MAGTALSDYTTANKGAVNTSNAGDYQGFFSPVWNMLKSLFNSVVDFFSDLILELISMILELILFVANLVQLPNISASLQSVVSGLSPDISYFLTQTGFYEALVIVGGGYSFYLLRRLLTLGNW